MNWYTVRVISGREKKIREAILFDIEDADMSELIKKVLVPTENVIEIKD